MSTIPASVKCDGCGKNRIEDSNHWVSIYFDPEQCGGENGLYIWQGINKDLTQKHACGQECATKLFQKWFAEGKL